MTKTSLPHHAIFTVYVVKETEKTIGFSLICLGSDERDPCILTNTKVVSKDSLSSRGNNVGIMGSQPSHTWYTSNHN